MPKLKLSRHYHENYRGARTYKYSLPGPEVVFDVEPNWDKYSARLAKHSSGEYNEETGDGQ